MDCSKQSTFNCISIVAWIDWLESDEANAHSADKCVDGGNENGQRYSDNGENRRNTSTELAVLLDFILNIVGLLVDFFRDVLQESRIFPPHEIFRRERV